MCSFGCFDAMCGVLKPMSLTERCAILPLCLFMLGVANWNSSATMNFIPSRQSPMPVGFVQY